MEVNEQIVSDQLTETMSEAEFKWSVRYLHQKLQGEMKNFEKLQKRRLQLDRDLRFYEARRDVLAKFGERLQKIGEAIQANAKAATDIITEDLKDGKETNG